MKLLSLRFLTVAVQGGVFAAFLSFDVAQAQSQEASKGAAEMGAISGTVSSAATHNMLASVVVAIPALGRQVVTDSNGQFLLQDVPSGPADVVFSYTGSDEDRRTIVISAHQTETLAIELKATQAVVMEKYVVAAQEEGEAVAMMEQKNAPNIINVQALDSDISSSDIPNYDVGVQAMSLPGVTGNISIGTVNALFINGFPLTLTRMTFDGLSGLNAGDGRRPTFTFLSSSLFANMELISAVTPDVSADSIGGTINLISPSPLSMSDNQRFSYDAGIYWSPPFSSYRSDYQASHSVDGYYGLGYQGVFSVLGGHRNLGVLVRTFWGSDAANYGYLYYNYEPGGANPAYIWDYRTFDTTDKRDVSGLNVKVEYRPSDAHKFFFQMLYNEDDEPMFWNQTTRAFSAETISNGTTGAVVPGFTNNLTQVLPVSGSNFTTTTQSTSSRNRNFVYTLGGTDTFGPLTLDWTGRYNFNRDEIGTGNNLSGGMLTMTDPTIGWQLSRNSNLSSPTFTQTAGSSIYNINSYNNSVTFMTRNQPVVNTNIEAKADATYQPINSDFLTFKTGVYYKNQDFKQLFRNPEQWAPVAGVSPSLFLPAVYLPKYPYDAGIPMVEGQDMVPYLTNPALWTENEYYRIMEDFQSYSVVENVEGEYVQGQAKLGRLTVLGGLRVEETEDVGYAYVEVPPATAAQIPDPIARAFHDWDNPVQNHGSYTYRFPSIFLNYRITNDLVAQASYSTSFGRPPYTDLTPNATINTTTQVVSTGNPSLLPEYSENWDFQLSYYFNPAGAFSVHYLRKTVSDYIETTSVGMVGSGPNNGYGGNYAGYQLNSDINLGSARVAGWEFAYNQKLVFLPGPLKGLELAGSYTMLQTEGNFGGTTIVNGSAVSNFIPKSASASLAYHYGRYGTRLIFNYQCPYLMTLGATPSANIYNDYRKSLSVNVNYTFNPKLSFYAQVYNVLQENQDSYIGNPNQLMMRIFNAAELQMGVKGQF